MADIAGEDRVVILNAVQVKGHSLLGVSTLLTQCFRNVTPMLFSFVSCSVHVHHHP